MGERRLCAASAVFLAAFLWAACKGDAYVDLDQGPPCDSTAECMPEQTRWQCIAGRCQCPNPEEEESCCAPGANEEEGDLCERQCRPISECNATR